MNVQVETEKRNPKIKKELIKMPLDLKWSMVGIVVLSFIGFLMQSVIQNGLLSSMHFVYFSYPAVILFNILPIFLIITFFYFVTGRIWIGTIITYIPLMLLNVANFFKTYFRDDPLKMSDIQLINEMENMMQKYELKINAGIMAGVIVAGVAVFIAVRYLKSQKLKGTIRIAGIAVVLLCMLLSYNFIYADKGLYESIPTKAEPYYDADMTKHHGLLYSFLVSADSATYNMPEGYSDDKARQILAQYAPASISAEQTKKINVIAVMGEAFFDVTRGGTVQFAKGTDPYANYHRIQAEGYTGKLIVPGYGGNTEATEFEFLTGASQYLLDESMPTAYKTYATREAYSLVRYFKDEGYDTVAIHPGNSWFYNRKSSYVNLGFDKFTSRENMDEDAPEIYGYIKDEYTTQQIINDYTEHYNQSPATPYFSFTVTIQNHGPYATYDCGGDMIYTKPDGLSDENFWVLNNYLNGIRDTDKLLGDICSFASERQEPVVVLFFGDHLPYLDEKIECFKAVGYNISHRNEEGIENKYTVEYVMWSNDAARRVIEKSCGEVKTGEGPEISAGFLGTELLDYMGAGKPAYFEFVSTVQQKINVISPNYYKSGDVKTSQIEGENAELLSKYKILQYYNFRRYNND